VTKPLEMQADVRRGDRRCALDLRPRLDWRSSPKSPTAPSRRTMTNGAHQGTPWLRVHRDRMIRSGSHARHQLLP